MCVFLIGFLVFGPKDVHAGLARIWAIDDTEKIKRTDNGATIKKDENGVPLNVSPKNTLWNNSTKTISIFGAKNEMVGFQVILEGDAAGLSNVEVKINPLSKVGGSYQIKNAAGAQGPYDYVGKRLEVFQVWYLNHTERSHPAQVPLPNPYYIGWIPDVLIPSATDTQISPPLTVLANQNQAAWIDIFVPEDAPAGDYTGSVEVRQNGSLLETLPVKLKVYNFKISEINHTKNFFIFEPAQLVPRHGITERNAAFPDLVKKYMFLGHRYRMDLSPRANLTEMEASYKKFLNGDNYKIAAGYDGPALGAYHTTYPIGSHDLCKEPTDPGCENNGLSSGFHPETRAQWWKAADEWVNYFNEPANGLRNVEIFRMMLDEPRHPPEAREYQYSHIQKVSTWLHTNPGPGKALKAFCTAGVDEPILYGYCDYWGLGRGAQYQQDKVDMLKAEYGNKFGLKNANRPYSGTGLKASDTSLTEVRVLPWVMKRYDLNHLMFWIVTNNYKNQQTMNLFTTPYYNQVTNDGRLFYPGVDVLFPGSSRGIQGPFASMRITGWRKGMQDLEYVYLAEQMGLGSQAREIVANVIPRGMDDITDEEPPTYSEYGYAFESARKQLAELIASRLAPTPTPTCALGDFDCNGQTNASDLQKLLPRWFTTTQGDYNRDQAVNIVDYLVTLAGF